MVFSVMTQEAAASANVPTQRQRSDLLGIAYLAWIAGLVWGAMAFFNWLV